MSNPISKFLFSTRLMAVLFIVFAAAMAAGTFIEDAYSTTTARIYIYNTKWFEAIMLLFVINFFGNIKRYRLLKKEKWAVLLLHLSFIFIIVGAGVTRYLGDEGQVTIPEGETVDYYVSSKAYLNVMVDGMVNGEKARRSLQKDFLFSEQADNFYANNNFKWKYDMGGQDFTIEYVDFMHGVEEGFVPSEDGEEYLKLVESSNGGRHDHYLKNGTDASIHNIIFSLNKPSNGAINIRTSDSAYTLESPFAGNYMRMSDQSRGDFNSDTIQEIQFPSLFTTEAIQFAIPEKMVRGSYDIVRLPENEVTKDSEEVLVVKVTSNGESKLVKILGGKGYTNSPKTVTVGGMDFHLTFGSIRRPLPFKVKLNDFIVEKYAGSETPLSYMSKVVVEDEKPFEFDIFMNHILDYKGYRMYQASYLPDESGTVLSVNHDWWGTNITYLGYYLLYAGLLGIMFYGKTRFKDLGKKLIKIKEKRKFLAIALLVFSGLQLNAQHTDNDGHEHTNSMRVPTEKERETMIHSTTVSPEHAAKFGGLIIQDGGRMKPINTFSSELLRKLSKYDTYQDLNADQVFLSMMQNPTPWFYEPIIFIEKHNDSLHHILGVPEKVKFVSMADFFDERGSYKIQPYLEEAFRAGNPNKFQTDFINVNLKIELLDRALSGGILQIFPVPNDPNNKWISQLDYLQDRSIVQDSAYANFIGASLKYYKGTLAQAKMDGDYSNSEKILDAFEKNQRKYTNEIMPDQDKIKAELLYNKYDLFKKLFSWYLYVALFMFVFLIAQIFKDNKATKVLVNVCKTLVFVLFVLHTLNLGVRWYISGHAPWSNAYESIIYVAWATMGMGLLFARKSNWTVAATAFVTCMLLMVAHWNWMDPEIDNLRPVLNSYWLMIHVAVIVACYGPFTVGFMLGLVCMLLYIFTTKKTKAKIELVTQELTVISELTLTVGLVMLTIGNFLGGQWANESWGRYWSWDPKETWALISIMVYAFVVHMRLVPGLRGRFTFNVFSVFAYASILMTYFGVNFYLSGLHSYASGERVDLLIWEYLGGGALVLSIIAYFRYRVNFKNK